MRTKSVLYTLTITVCAVFVGLCVYTNVDTEVSVADQLVFSRELGLKKPIYKLEFEQQVQLIQEVQTRLFKRVPPGKNIALGQSREPSDLLQHGSGICFDRSRTLDKVFKWLGFETRHVFLFISQKQEELHFVDKVDLITDRDSWSHAVTEVKTVKGWVVVDSLENWASFDNHGLPVAAEDINSNLPRFAYVPSLLNKNSFVVKGLYSRSGVLYPPFVFFPDLAWGDFLSWLFGID